MIIDLNVFVRDSEKALSPCWQAPREPEARGSRSLNRSMTQRNWLERQQRSLRRLSDGSKMPLASVSI